MRIAILGAGHMGRAVGSRLLEKGHHITVWNRSPGRTETLEKAGAAVAGSPAEAAKSADVVMMLLTADEAVKAVAYAGGVIEALRPESFLIDMSTVSPDTSRDLGEHTPHNRFVDAPILGGPEATRNGKSKLLLGGSQATVDGLEPLWRDIASEYCYCGPNGSATTLKLLSNLMLVGGTALLAEAIVTAQANGLDNDVLTTVLKQSPAVAPGVQVRFDDVASGDHDGWWTIKLAQKDMSLAVALAESKGLHLPLSEATIGALKTTDEAGLGDSDLGAVVEPLRRS